MVAPRAGAESPRNRLLWMRGDRAYVALSDTARVAEGDSVRFEEKRKLIASGRVASVLHGELAIVAVTLGSLDGVKKPERVLVSMVRPTPTRPASLRIALPASDRSNLLFGCDRVVPRLPAGAPPYRADTLDYLHLRLTRVPEQASDFSWPDTLYITLFGSAPDEEIALERGDVDVAVFWPGEPSRRIRDDPRWRGSPAGVRSRGVVALVGDDGITESAPESTLTTEFNERFFRGDLRPRGTLPGSPGGEPKRPWIFEADGSLPGRLPIRTWLADRGLLRSANGQPSALARLTFIDAPFDTTAGPGFQPLFVVRCPILCDPPTRRFVDGLGANVLADMPQCVRVHRSPGLKER